MIRSDITMNSASAFSIQFTVAHLPMQVIADPRKGRGDTDNSFRFVERQIASLALFQKYR